MTDVQLRKCGFDPLLVHGIGTRSWVCVSLQDEGYSKLQIKAVMDFHDSLIAH